MLERMYESDTSSLAEAIENANVSDVAETFTEAVNTGVEESTKVVDRLYTTLTDFLQSVMNGALGFIVSVLLAFLVYLIGVKLLKWARKLIGKAMEKGNIDHGVVSFVDSLVNVGGYILIIMFILSLFGVTTASVTAVLASAGLAIGLALQGFLSNFAGGVLILVTKPFTVHDYVVVNGGEGTVESITVIYTTLKTPDGKTIVIPNGSITGSAMTNITREGKRRVDITVGISYGADIKAAKEVLLATVNADEAVLQGEANNVVVGELADSSVNLCVMAWVASADWVPTKARLTESCKYALDKAGIEIPFNQIDVHMINS